MISEKKDNNPLKQAFYLSREFRKIKAETRDIRIHPILGGISSTRWKAYKKFIARNSVLSLNLEFKDPYKNAIQLTNKVVNEIITKAPDINTIKYLKRKNWRLKDKGMLSGDRRQNILTGSATEDVIMGWNGKDRIIGMGGGDLLSGGKGADLFVFRPDQNQTSETRDIITDFQGKKGDRIRIHGAKKFLGYKAFTGQPGEVNFIVWMAAMETKDENTIGGHHGVYQGAHIRIDRDGDRLADQVIDLPCVAWIKQNWILTD